MARRFSYQDDAALGAVVGQSLGRALFGDPAMAQAQQEHVATMALRDAQAAQANAHARLYGNQADIAGSQAGAIKSLPDLFRSFVTAPTPAAPAPAVDPSLDPISAIANAAPPVEASAPVFNQEAFQSGLPAVFAALAQARGENVDPNEIVGGLAAMLGSDEFARRGLVTMGHTPGENFALTPDRADAISSRDAKEDLGKALAVENIESADRRYGVDVRSGDTRRGQDIASSDRQRGQDIRASTRSATVESRRVEKLNVVNSAGRKMVLKLVKERLGLDEDNPKHKRILSAAMRRAVYHFQRSGNPDDAVANMVRESGIEALRSPAGPVRLSATNADPEYERLPVGSQFIGPDGRLRVKR